MQNDNKGDPVSKDKISEMDVERQKPKDEDESEIMTLTSEIMHY